MAVLEQNLKLIRTTLEPSVLDRHHYAALFCMSEYQAVEKYHCSAARRLELCSIGAMLHLQAGNVPIKNGVYARPHGSDRGKSPVAVQVSGVGLSGAGETA